MGMEQFKCLSSSLKNDWARRMCMYNTPVLHHISTIGRGYGGLSNTHIDVYARKYCNNCLEMNHNLCVERKFKTAEICQQYCCSLLFSTLLAHDDASKKAKLAVLGEGRGWG